MLNETSSRKELSLMYSPITLRTLVLSVTAKTTKLYKSQIGANKHPRLNN
jgi:hypothetical protein